MSKKEKDSILDEFEKLKNEIIRDKVSDIFRKHPKDYIAKLEELGFKYFEDEDDDSEEIEERNAKPENQRQRDLVAYFESKIILSDKIFESFTEEKDSDSPNFPLIRKYFRKTNKRKIIEFLISKEEEIDRKLKDLLFVNAFFHNIIKLLETRVFVNLIFEVSFDIFLPAPITTC